MSANEKEQTAELRRELLRQAMQNHNLTPTKIARKLGWNNPNAIYNFLNRHSSSLDTTTLQQILTVMPGKTMQYLLGQKAVEVPSLVLLNVICQSGQTREAVFLADGNVKQIPLPVEEAARNAGAHAALVRHPGAESIYADGSILLCIPVNRFIGTIRNGKRLVVERAAGKRVETTVREIQEDSNGKLWLSMRSTLPSLSKAVSLPKAALKGSEWQSGGDKFVVHSVVIGAFIPE